MEDGGIAAGDGLEMARRFAASGLVDFLNVIRGRIHTDAAMTEVIPIQGMRSAPHLDFAGQVRAEVGLPTFHAARIPDVATARHAVATGLLDMVGMTRAHMADPHIVQKIIAGHEDDDPSLRRRHLLPGPDLSGRHGAVHPQPLYRARGGTAASASPRRRCARRS